VAELEKPKIKPRHWVALWSKDEKFWKDVAANTVAGILLALIVYLFGLAAGYFQRPNWTQEALPVLASIAFGTAGIVAIYILVLLIQGGQPKEFRKHLWMALYATLMGVAAMYFLATTL
jgi:uncharacterized membrane protein